MKPHNEQHQTELSILGFILARGDRPYIAGDVFATCPVKAFLHGDTRAVAEAVVSCVAKGIDTDIVHVVYELRDMGKLAFIGGAGIVSELAVEHGSDILTEYGLMDSVSQLVSEHRKREAAVSMAGIMRDMQTPGTMADCIAENLRATAGILESGDDALEASFSRQLDAYEAELDSDERSVRPVKTPWRTLNAILRGGILPGELAILAARPSVGKSAFALNLAWSVACSGMKSVLFSLEMPRQQLFDRLVSNVGDIDVGRFREGLSAREIALVKETMARLHGKPFVVTDDTRVTVGDIRRRVRIEQRAGKTVGMVVVDYLQLMTAQTKSPSREREVAEMSRALKLMANELRVPVLVLAQLNRKSEEGKRPPMLSDLRESGAIEQDADIVIFLHQARQIWHPDEPVRVIVAKGRSSGVGQEHLVFQRKYQRFVDSSEAAYTDAIRQEEAEQTRHWTEQQGDLA